MNQEQLEAEILRLAQAAKLNAWNEFVEELHVPSEIYPAILTNRPELIRLARRRPLTAQETDALYKLIAALIETNSALREHAAQVAALVHDWTSMFYGMQTTARKVQWFAQFRHSELTQAENEDTQ